MSNIFFNDRIDTVLRSAFKMQDITILLEDKPGTLAEVTEALGKANINIEGGCGYSAIGRGIFHILIEDAEQAKNALSATRITVSEIREMVVLDVKNDPEDYTGYKAIHRIANELPNSFVQNSVGTKFVI